MHTFLNSVIGRTTDYLYICSLLNNGATGGPVEQHISTRDLNAVDAFVKQWDIVDRGMYLCMSTLGQRVRRVKQNASETFSLHLDIDPQDISIPLQDVQTILLGLSHPPSWINNSGRGIHAYWFLTEPSADEDRVEAALKKLADAMSGDRKVAQRVALMRLEGTHNTKEGGWLEVKSLYESTTQYTFEDLESWLADGKVYVSRKGAAPEKNPFLSYAETIAFKTPIDVDARLAAMKCQGSGDTAVHATQLSVTASMLTSGVALDDVVSKVLEATKNVAPAKWNWKSEEATIRKMCTDWMYKQSKVKSAQVVNLADRRAERDTNTDKAPKKSVVHIVLGGGFLTSLNARGDRILIVRDQVWRYTAGLWKSLTAIEAKAWINMEVESGCRVLGVISTTKIINETYNWIIRNPDISRDFIEWDNHGKIATKSGLVDPVTLKLTPTTSDDYVTVRIECDFDPAAACPKWEKMLSDCFPDNKDTVESICECVGSALLINKPRPLMRALVLVGPSNSGKSNILNTVSGLLTDCPNTTTFDTLETNHGTSDFLRNAPWILHEAFDQGKWHFSSSVKALLSGDPININIKYGAIVQHRFKGGVFWGSNTPPQFKEASRAVQNRLKIAPCSAIFDTNTETGVAADAKRAGYSTPSEFVLHTEKSGILNWAIVGMQTAVQRGHLLDTEEMKEAAHTYHLETNMVAGFLEDAIDYDPLHMVSKPDFNAAFSVWWKENHGEGSRTPSADGIGRAMSSLYDKRIAFDKMKTRYNGIRYYAGIKLNPTGLDMWKAFFNVAASKGDSVRISSSTAAVNVAIPADWSKKDFIINMRNAQKTFSRRKKND